MSRLMWLGAFVFLLGVIQMTPFIRRRTAQRGLTGGLHGARYHSFDRLYCLQFSKILKCCDDQLKPQPKEGLSLASGNPAKADIS